MLSFKDPFSAFASLLFISAITLLVGCSQSTSPTAPTSAAALVTDHGMANAESSSSIIFVIDTAFKGSESQLNGFDGVSLLSFTNTN